MYVAQRQHMFIALLTRCHRLRGTAQRMLRLPLEVSSFRSLCIYRCV